MAIDLSQFMDVDWVKTQSTLADNLGIPLTNRFACLLNAPAGDATLKKNGWLEIQVIGVDCPNISIDSAELELNGLRRFYFKGRTDGDLTITFLESSDLVLRRFFYEWIKQAVDIDFTGGVKRHYMSEFAASDIIVAPLDFEGKAHYGDRFIKIFPVNIHDITYNYGTNNDIIKTAVTFKYMFHQVASMTNGIDGKHFTATSSDLKNEVWSQ